MAKEDWQTGDSVTAPIMNALGAEVNSKVKTVAGRTGDVVLTKADVGLDNVDNSKDEWKWVAAAGRLSSDYKINGVSFNATQDITISVPESVTPRTWHDIFAFGTINGWPTFETRTGSTWSSTSLGKEVFDLKDGSYSDLIPENGSVDGCRYTWASSNLPWSQFEHIVMILNNSGGAARTLKYTIQNSLDGVAWTDFGTLTSPDWSVTLDLPTSWSWGEWPYLRLLIERTSGTGGLRMTGISALTRRMGDQGGGRETEFPYDWDANKVITFNAIPLIAGTPTAVNHAVRKDYVDAQVATRGTSNLALGTTGTTAAAGNHTHTAANVGAVQNVSGASGLWIGSAASLPGTGTAGVLYVTYP